MAASAELILLGRLLPLALGAAISPVLLLLQLLNLSAPQRPLQRSLAFLLGCALVMALWLLGAAWMAWLPPAVVLLSGEPGRRRLQRLARWVQPRQCLLNGAVALALAVLLLARAWGRF